MVDLTNIADARIGVFAWVRSDGAPMSCPVTPFVIGDHVVVTSTLAYTAKAAAVRRDPRVALLAGGLCASGEAEVFVDESPLWFDEHLRRAEMEKFPPTKSLLSVPGHRCLFPWYVGRIVIQFRPNEVILAGKSDNITATQLVKDRLQITPIQVGPSGVPVTGHLENGPVSILFHEEYADLADLRQMTWRGSILNGEFLEDERRGSLAPSPSGPLAQLSQLRSMARSAKTNKDRIKSWTAA